jgi:hypothetical protein
MKFHVEQMSLSTAIMTEIDRQAKERGIPALALDAYQLNAIFKGATAIVEEIARELKDSAPGKGLRQWLDSDDTGMSSMAMAHHLCGAPLRDGDSGKNHPLDPSDFGRCHRFLEAVPDARDRMLKMAAVSAAWARLIGAWDELTKLYLEEVPSGMAPRLYDRMKELGC